MRVIITKKEEFAGKNGKEYVKLYFVDAGGVAGSVFTDKDTYVSKKFDETCIATSETLKKISGCGDIVELDFDQTGRFVNIAG